MAKCLFQIILLFNVSVQYAFQGDPFFSKVGVIDLRPNLAIETYEMCDNQGNGLFVFRGRNSRINRTLVVENSRFELKVPFDHKVKMKIRMDLWGNGGWRLNGYTYEVPNSCDGMLHLLGEEVSRELFSHFTPRVEPKCPIKAGVYTESDMDVTWYNKINAPGFMVGLWRIDIMFTRTNSDELLGCFRRRMRISFKNTVRNGTGIGATM